MNFENNKKYYLPRKVTWQIIGGIIAAIGVPFFFLRQMGFYGGTMIALILVLIGVCIVIFANSSRPSDADIENCIAIKTKDVMERARMYIDTREKMIKAYPPMTFCEYDFSEADSEEFLVQRGKDGRYRTNKYSYAIITFGQEKLHTYMYQFSLTKDWEQDTALDYKYTDLLSAEIERMSHIFKFGVKGIETKVDFESMVIRKNDGEVIFTMPVRHAADVDKTVETINHLIKSRKDEASGANSI
ncbi:MAG: hypothetical protein WBI55_08510 [Eubacteriales bacterium]|jgi:uncharacterized membrane protein|nr:hypothetical protein [Clostridiales bacterium]